MDVVSSFAVMLQEFAVVMTANTLANFSILVSGWMFAPRRNITSMIVAAGMAGVKALVGVFIGGPIGAFVALGFGVICTSIVQSSASGQKKIENWPEYDMVEWFGYTLQYWLPAFIALLPGMILGLFASQLDFMVFFVKLARRSGDRGPENNDGHFCGRGTATHEHAVHDPAAQRRQQQRHDLEAVGRSQNERRN